MAEAKLQALPFAEAIAALKTRRDNPLPSNRWQEVFGEEHAIAGTVARSVGFDILGDILGSLQETLEKGGTFETWKKDITPVLKAKGWWGKTTDAEGRTVQLGSPHRLATIFDVNMRVSYGAGRWEQIQRVKARRPWLRYVAVQDERTRKSHKGWHGTILAVDDPWWDTHYPPNGWRCRCTVVQLSDRDLARYGWTPSPAAPPSPTTTWRNPVTGDVVDVPAGIDPGWGHNVGKARETALQALAKVDRLPAPAGAAAATLIRPDMVADEFAAWATRWSAQIRAAKNQKGILQPAGEAKSIGALSPAVVARMEALAAAGEAVPVPEAAAIWISERELIHLMRTAKAKATTKSGLPKALPLEDVVRLPHHIRNAAATYWDKETDSVVVVFRSVTAERPDDMGKAAVRVNVTVKEPRAPDAPPGPRRTSVRNQIMTAGWERHFEPPRYIRLDQGE